MISSPGRGPGRAQAAAGAIDDRVALDQAGSGNIRGSAEQARGGLTMEFNAQSLILRPESGRLYHSPFRAVKTQVRSADVPQSEDIGAAQEPTNQKYSLMGRSSVRAGTEPGFRRVSMGISFFEDHGIQLPGSLARVPFREIPGRPVREAGLANVSGEGIAKGVEEAKKWIPHLSRSQRRARRGIRRTGIRPPPPGSPSSQSGSHCWEDAVRLEAQLGRPVEFPGVQQAGSRRLDRRRRIEGR